MNIKIEVHGSVKEIGISRPKEFGEKIITLEDCDRIKILPRNNCDLYEFLEIIISQRLNPKARNKEERVITYYTIRAASSMDVKPDVSNVIHITKRTDT